MDLAAIAEAEGNRLPVKPNPRHVYSIGPGDLLATRLKKGLRVESDQLRVLVTEMGANNSITAINAEDTGGAVGGTVGPPFSPSEFHTLDFELGFEHRGGTVEVTAVGRSKRWPGFVLTKKFSIGSGPVVESWMEAFNGEMASRTLQFRVGAGTRSGFGTAPGELVLPLAAGITRGPDAESFPGSDDEESKKPGRLVEDWWAHEVEGGGLVGGVWTGEFEEVERSGMSLTTPKIELAPGQRASTERLWLFAGSGTWRQVRNLWRRRAGVVEATDSPEEASAPAMAISSPDGPALVVGGQGEVRLRVTSETTWAVGGKLTLVPPEGWTVEPREVDTSSLTWKTPTDLELKITAPTSAAGLLTAELDGSELSRQLELPLLAVPDTGPVEILRGEDNGNEAWTLQTSQAEVKVVPSFGGATVSWKVDGVEQLASDYPEASSIAWMLPWHGGISPVLIGGDGFPGTLWKETFETEEVEEKDETGLVWRGIRVSGTSSHEDSRGLRVESEVLALGGAPVLKQVVRLVNPTGAARDPIFGTMIFCAPGGSRDGTRAHGEGLILNSSGRIGFNSPGTWAAAENPETGATVLMCSPRRVGSIKLGFEGAHFMNLRNPEVAAGESWESVSYLVASPSLEEAKAWRALTQLG